MIGQLRERVGLYRAQTEPDGLGGERRTWRFAFAAWAGLEPLAPVETETGRVLRRFRCTLRHRTDIPQPARLVWRGETFSVLAHSDPDVRGERLHLILQET